MKELLSTWHERWAYRKWRVRVEFAPRELWVGLRVKEPWNENPFWQRWYLVRVCVVPCLPIVITWAGKKQGDG